MNKSNENWILLLRINNEITLEKIKSELEQGGIPYSVVNKKDSSFLIGDYEIYIPVELLSNAKNILKEFDVNLE